MENTKRKALDRKYVARIDELLKSLQEQGYNISLHREKKAFSFLKIPQKFHDIYHYKLSSPYRVMKSFESIVQRLQKYPPFMIKNKPDTEPLHILLCESLAGFNGYATVYHPSVREHIALAVGNVFRGGASDDTFEHEMFHHFDDLDGKTLDDGPRTRIHQRGGFAYDAKNWSRKAGIHGVAELYGYKDVDEDQATMGEIIYAPAMSRVQKLLVDKVSGWRTLAKKVRLITGCDFVIKAKGIEFTRELFDPKRYQIFTRDASWKKLGYQEPEYYAKWSRDPVSNEILMNCDFWNAICRQESVSWERREDGSYRVVLL